MSNSSGPLVTTFRAVTSCVLPEAMIPLEHRIAVGDAREPACLLLDGQDERRGGDQLLGTGPELPAESLGHPAKLR
jgi:hypothetical protein